MTDRTVVHVVYPGVGILDVVGQREVFAAVNRFTESRPRYRQLVASVDGRPITTGWSGPRFGATHLHALDERPAGDALHAAPAPLGAPATQALAVDH
jgi:hypothetical protein